MPCNKEVLWVKRFVSGIAWLKNKHKKGQGMVEYALIIGFIALLVIGALKLIPQPLEDILGDIAAALGAPPP